MRKFLAITMLTGALFVALCPLLIVPGAAAAEPAVPRQVRNSLRQAERSLGLQTQMPTGKTAGDEAGVRPNPPDFSGNGWLMSPEMAQIILWVSVGAVAAVLLLCLRDNLWSNSRSRRLRREDSGEAASSATVARMDRAQFEADVHAERGDYAEAMHVLLLQSVSELRRRLDVSIASSLTSREILRHLGLSPKARELFSDIVGRVEISYFGQHRPAQDDYLACRRSYEGLSASLAEAGGESPGFRPGGLDRLGEDPV